MAIGQIDKVHGSAAPGAFYGLQPLVVKVADSTNGFTADTVDGNGQITAEGGYAKAVKALESVASVVWLGAQANGSFTAVVDGGTANNGAGATTAGAWGALRDAMVSQVGGSAGDYTVTTSSVLNGAGTFTFA